MKVKDIRLMLDSAANMIVYIAKNKEDIYKGNYKKLGGITYCFDNSIPSFIDDLIVLSIYPNKKGEELEIWAKYDEE